MYDEVNGARKVVVENLGTKENLTITHEGEAFVNVGAVDALIGAIGMTGMLLMDERTTRSYGALIKMGHNLKALADLAHGYYTIENYRAEDNPPMPGSEEIRRIYEGEQAAKNDEILKRLEGELDN